MRRRALLTAAVLGLCCSLPVAAQGEPPIEPGRCAGANGNEASSAIADEAAPAADPEQAARDDPAAQPGGCRWDGPPRPSPDWRGAARDTGYFVGYQVFALAALYAAPQSVSGWSDEDKQNQAADNWRDNVSQPVWDEDSWWVNYVLHPYWGGAYYIRGRERGLDRLQSFWYAALLSTLWEYGVEAFAEPVSIQDLIVTPVLGSLVGEYLFTPWRARIRAKPGELDWFDKTVLTLTDPLGAVNEQLDRWLGVKTTLQFQPTGQRWRTPAPNPPALGSPGPARRGAAGWRLQLRMEW